MTCEVHESVKEKVLDAFRAQSGVKLSTSEVNELVSMLSELKREIVTLRHSIDEATETAKTAESQYMSAAKALAEIDRIAESYAGWRKV